MKKILATILAVIYLSTSIGATLHTHYCMGQFVSFSLWHKKSSPGFCEKCGMPLKQKKGCCEDKHTTIKIKGDHKTSQCSFNFFNWATQLLIVHHEIAPAKIISAIPASPTVESGPPGKFKVPFFLLNCIFRI